MFEEYFFEKQRVINIFAQFHMKIEFSLKSIGYNNFNEQMMISEDSCSDTQCRAENDNSQGYCKAKCWYEKAEAATDHPDVRRAARTALGRLYFEGKGVEQDSDKAFEYWYPEFLKIKVAQEKTVSWEQTGVKLTIDYPKFSSKISKNGLPIAYTYYKSIFNGTLSSDSKSRIFIDNSLVKLDDHGKFDGGDKLWDKFSSSTTSDRVKLPIDVELKIDGSYKNVLHKDVMIKLIPDPMPAPILPANTNLWGKCNVLLIANQDYVDPNIEDLHTPISDIKAVSDVLQTKYGCKLIAGLQYNLTRDGLLNLLKEETSSLTETDNLIIYYTGHGEYKKIDEKEESFWLTQDSEIDLNSNSIKIDTAVSGDEIKQILREKKNTKHILIIADSCFSGYLSATHEPFLAPFHLSQNMSRTLLSSGNKELVNDNGLFAKAFIEVLEKHADFTRNHKAQPLTMSQIFREVKNRFEQLEDERDVERTQEITYKTLKDANHAGGDMILVPYHESGFKTK